MPPQTIYTPVSARPVKRFFVEMLTRDLQLEDAILDLLDNCLDGILRSDLKNDDGDQPYDGFWAKISVKGDSFDIQDNCGGIPWSEHDRAFRMGRPVSADREEPPSSVGVYGIGMKRAIFKMGNEAFILTQNKGDNYQVLVSAAWVQNEDLWDLEVRPDNGHMEEDGTHILVQGLYPEVSEMFVAERFQDDLLHKIASHYAVILRKGFRVEVNGVVAVPNPIVVRFATQTDGYSEVRPYIFKSDYNGVDVFVTVGLREPIPGIERTTEEQEGVKFLSDYAGWTVICNDRVVLYCNRDELTGWGLFGIPRYHTQFIAISGVVEFRGDPRNLPTTTTKRGLNFSSSLYQQVLERMRDGLRLFVDFTNTWKSMEKEAKDIVDPVPNVPYYQIRTEAEKLSFHATKRGLPGEQYIPKLPRPKTETTDVRISFLCPKKKVSRLADKILPNIDDLRDKDIPRSVGQASFDFAYNHFFAKK